MLDHTLLVYWLWIVVLILAVVRVITLLFRDSWGAKALSALKRAVCPGGKVQRATFVRATQAFEPHIWRASYKLRVL
jgi:hypothetical protein